MARFHLDHDVSLRLAPLLRAGGHDAVTAQQLGLAHETDEVHLLLASQQQRVLVTHNRRDYVLLHRAWHRWPPAWGVVVPPHSGLLSLDHRPESELAAAVNQLLARLGSAPLEGQLHWWRAPSGWSRLLEDGSWARLP